MAADLHELAVEHNVESNGEEGFVTSEIVGDAATHHEEINPRFFPIDEENAELTPQFFLATLAATE